MTKSEMEREIRAMRAGIEKLTAERDELVETLMDAIAQACHVEQPRSDGGELESGCLSAYRDGLVLLAKLGKVEILRQHGRAVVAKWVRDDR